MMNRCAIKGEGEVDGVGGRGIEEMGKGGERETGDER